MKWFEPLDLPIVDNVFEDLNTLIQQGQINWHSTMNQISINTVPGQENNFHYGVGSLDKDWANSYTTVVNGVTTIVVPDKDVMLSESDFTVLCNQFRGTKIEQIYNIITNNFKVGRIRLMKTQPSFCYSWHKDYTKRIHYPILTAPGNFMVISEEILHMPKHTWWKTNTTEYHTAFNGSKQDRIHIVAAIL